MKTILSTLTALVIALSAGLSYAGDDSGMLGRVGVNDAGRAYLYKDGASWSSSLLATGCTTTAWVAFDIGTTAGENMYRVALDAYLNGHPIKIYTTGCYVGVPLVTRIDIAPSF